MAVGSDAGRAGIVADDARDGLGACRGEGQRVAAALQVDAVCPGIRQRTVIWIGPGRDGAGGDRAGTGDDQRGAGLHKDIAARGEAAAAALGGGLAAAEAPDPGLRCPRGAATAPAAIAGGHARGATAAEAAVRAFDAAAAAAAPAAGAADPAIGIRAGLAAHTAAAAGRIGAAAAAARAARMTKDGHATTRRARDDTGSTRGGRRPDAAAARTAGAGAAQSTATAERCVSGTQAARAAFGRVIGEADIGQRYVAGIARHVGADEQAATEARAAAAARAAGTTRRQHVVDRQVANVHGSGIDDQPALCGAAIQGVAIADDIQGHPGLQVDGFKRGAAEVDVGAECDRRGAGDRTIRRLDSGIQFGHRGDDGGQCLQRAATRAVADDHIVGDGGQRVGQDQAFAVGPAGHRQGGAVEAGMRPGGEFHPRQIDRFVWPEGGHGIGECGRTVDRPVDAQRSCAGEGDGTRSGGGSGGDLKRSRLDRGSPGVGVDSLKQQHARAVHHHADAGEGRVVGCPRQRGVVDAAGNRAGIVGDHACYGLRALRREGQRVAGALHINAVAPGLREDIGTRVKRAAIGAGRDGAGRDRPRTGQHKGRAGLDEDVAARAKAAAAAGLQAGAAAHAGKGKPTRGAAGTSATAPTTETRVGRKDAFPNVAARGVEVLAAGIREGAVGESVAAAAAAAETAIATRVVRPVAAAAAAAPAAGTAARVSAIVLRLSKNYRRMPADTAAAAASGTATPASSAGTAAGFVRSGAAPGCPGDDAGAAAGCSGTYATATAATGVAAHAAATAALQPYNIMF